MDDAQLRFPKQYYYILQFFPGGCHKDREKKGDPMKVLVLGGCGFIGSHVVERMVREGHEVRVFDRLNASVGNIQGVLNHVDLRYADLSDEWAVEEAVKGIDIIIHLVTTTFPGTTRKSGMFDVRTNLVPTIYLLEAALRNNVKRILYLSSGGTVYGDCTDKPIEETDPAIPVTFYGLTKLTVENYIRLYCQSGPLRYVILRASNIYGPRQNIHGVQGLIAVTLGNAICNRPQILWGEGNTLRDYLHVDDLVEAMNLTIHQNVHGEVINIGSGDKVSTREVLSQVETVIGRKLKIIRKPELHQQIACNVLSIQKARGLLNWEPKIGLADGIHRTWDWVRANHGGPPNQEG